MFAEIVGGDELMTAPPPFVVVPFDCAVVFHLVQRPGEAETAQLSRGKLAASLCPCDV